MDVGVANLSCCELPDKASRAAHATTASYVRPTPTTAATRPVVMGSNAAADVMRRDASSFLGVYLDLHTPLPVVCPWDGATDHYAPDGPGVSRLSAVGSISIIAPEAPT